MLSYTLRRLNLLLFTLLGLTLLSYWLEVELSSIPVPHLVQGYLNYLSRLFSGEFGYSTQTGHPVLEDLASEYEGKVRIVKVDVTSCEQTASAYNIRNIPALLMFKNGEVVGQQVGAAPRSKLAAFIDAHL